nr:MAG TPA: hypothetical protein [Caudoviricetes sp.]DAY25659.1 MAG TPA: hypothetical protein [Caudoviricetes sp.]
MLSPIPFPPPPPLTLFIELVFLNSSSFHSPYCKQK